MNPMFTVLLTGLIALGTAKALADSPKAARAQELAATADTIGQEPGSADFMRVTSVEGITEYRLPNGLRVLLAPDDSVPRTTVNITYLVGSRDEGRAEAGMAHLLEHMMFKGTDTLTAASLREEFARRGMSANGTTTVDRTNYFATFPFSEDNLDWILRMEADRMVNSRLEAVDLRSEMPVVLNEMEIGQTQPQRVLLLALNATAYQWHPMAELLSARDMIWRTLQFRCYARFTSATTSPTMPCWWLAARSIRHGCWLPSPAISVRFPVPSAHSWPLSPPSPRRKVSVS